MRKTIKTVSSKAQKFIPKGHEEYDEAAKDIQDRPLVIMGRPLTREDRLNVQSLMETKDIASDGSLVVSNLGTIARYVWNNCALEVKNVIADEGVFESVKGDAKNRLFNAEGLEDEVMQFVAWVQEISRFSEEEAKN
jgi:hypothetical protein